MPRALKRNQPSRGSGGRWPPARNDLKTTAWILRETPAWRGSETEEQVLRGKANERTSRRLGGAAGGRGGPAPAALPPRAPQGSSAARPPPAPRPPRDLGLALALPAPPAPSSPAPGSSEAAGQTELRRLRRREGEWRAARSQNTTRSQKCLAQGPPPSFTRVAAGDVSRLQVHPYRAGWGEPELAASSGPGEERAG